MHTRWLNVMIIAVMLLGMMPFSVQAAPLSEIDPEPIAQMTSEGDEPTAEIESALLNKLADEGTADFVVVMAEQADLSKAYEIEDWDERGKYVYEALRATASRTQASVMGYAIQQDLEYESFFSVNTIHIKGGDLRSVQDIANLPGVALVRRPQIAYIDPSARIEGPAPLAPTGYGWNMDALDPDNNLYGMQAAQVWDQYGIEGEGIIVANIDTGVTYQHEALVRQYRGNLSGGAYDHDFSWYAPTTDAQVQCGGDAATSPCDEDGHGSGTAGIMVGETADLTEQNGAAPASKWIACMGCDGYGPGGPGGCSEAALTGCADWYVAPCPIGADPGDPSCDPSQRPHIINNSWGDVGGRDWYRGYIQAWVAAGMFPAFSAGNTAACAAVGSPGDNPEAFGTAAHGSNGQNLYAGGPSTFFPNPSCDPEAHEVDPHLNAPTFGRTPGNTPGSYYNLSGTSGASPHTAGAVALMWAANPALIGDILNTFTILEQSTNHNVPEGDCGKPACAGSNAYPNYEYGWGYLDALAAVEEAQLYGGGIGYIDGQVTDADSGDPVQGATVMATLEGQDRAWQTLTDESGIYDLTVFSGTYMLDAFKYGYSPAQITSLSVVSGTTTTQNIALTPAAFYEVSGQVTDAATGWPLYAKINIAGYPGDPVWTDPETGAYSISLAEGVTYTFQVEAWVDGYDESMRMVGPLTGDTTEDFALMADTAACIAPGYIISGTCEAPTDGGLVVGNVYDANYPLVALNDADIINEAGYAAATVPTPEDGAVDDGFYTLFAPSGAQTFTATAMGGYGAHVLDVTVVDGDTVAQDFLLPAGALSSAPAGLGVTVELGYAETVVLDLANVGALDANFEFLEKFADPTFVPLAAGGPDPFGYAFADSDDPDGPAYEWIEIAPPAGGTGTAVGMAGMDDDHHWPLDLPFTFNFYGVDYDQIALGSNGTVYFEDAYLGLSNTAIPGSNSYGVHTFVAHYWDDLVIDPGEVYYADLGDMFVIEYYQARLYSGSDYGTWQIVFYENGNILFQYQDAALDYGAGATVGIQGDTATGLQYSYNTAALSDDLAICFAYPGESTDCSPGDDVPWLSEDPITGTVSAAGDTSITVDFDAAYVDQPGEYHADLIVKNDTPYGKFNIPVTMTVTGPASWAKLTGTVTGLGACDDDPAPLEDAEVHVESATTGHTWTVTTDISGTYHLWLDQAHSPLTVTVSAPDYYDQEGGVEVVQGETTVLDFDLQLQQPCLSYDPADFDVTLPMGDNLVETLTLSNTGAAEAEFEFVEIEQPFVPAQVLQARVTMPGTLHSSTLEGVKQLVASSTSERTVDVPIYQILATTRDVLLVTPDDDISDLASVLAAFPDLVVTTYSGDLTTITGADLSPYDVVVTTNNTQWAAAGADVSVGNALADYIDMGGKVIVNNFAYDYAGWELAGRFIDEEYGPFTAATTDYMGSSSLGTIYEPGHPIMAGVSSITNSYLWQNQGLAAGATRIADWNDDSIFVAANQNVVGLNILPSDGNGAPGWTGDLPTLYHNAIMWLTTAASGADVPWLSEDPITGTLSADSSSLVDVAFDAGVPETMQPGEYHAQIKVSSNAANDVPNVPLTLTVTPPDDWGKLTGEVSGLGYCDTVTPTLLEDAEITVESSAGAIAWDLTTDVSGTYQLWLDAAHNPLTVTVEHPDHVTQVFTDVTVTAGGTTVLDAALRWDQPCLTVDPDLFDVTVTLGMSTTVPFSLTNWGAASANFGFVEANRGMLLMSDATQGLTPARQRLADDDSQAMTTDDTPQSLTEFVASGLSVPEERPVALSVPTGALQSVSFYDDRGDFDTDYPGLPVEDYENGTMPYASVNVIPHPLDEFSDNAYFDPGDILPGIQFWATNDQAGEEIAMLGEDFMSNPSKTAVANFFADSYHIVFDPPVFAAGMDIQEYMGSYSCQVDIYDAGGLLLGSDVSACDEAGVFWGVASAASPIAEIVITSLGGGAQGADNIAFGGEPPDIPWLSEDPESGAVDADNTFLVDLTFDATDAVTQVTQPGEYFGTLFVTSDDPFNNNIPVPVTMTVEPPATWGKLMGTVQSLGYCDADPAPVADQEVLIEGSGGVSWTVTTDVSGTYQLWLDEMYSPLTVTVAATDHETGTVTGVTVISGTTTTQDFDLRWLEPCVAADPMALHATLELGATATEALTLTNTGAVSTAWDLAEENLGAPTVTPPGVSQLFFEDFEGAFPPAGWVVTETGATDDPGWVTTTARVHSGTYAVYHNDDDTTGNSISWLIMPQVSIPAGGAELAFWQNQNWSGYYDYHGMWVSTATNDPADFVEWIELGPGTEDVWEEIVLSLDAYAGQDVYLAFRYEGDYADEWYIDDVAIQQVDPVTWLAENPAFGNLVADTGEQVVDVDFDASVTGIDQPGDYLASLWVNSDDPTAPAILPVTMTVTPPATWGELLGVVSSLGHCDAEMNPLEGAEVVIWDSAAPVVTLTTDISGAYSYWLPADAYTVTFSAPDHATEVITDVTVTAAATTTQDASLTWLGPCVTDITPSSMEVTLAMGMSETLPLTMTNVGAGALNFQFVEMNGGFTPMLMMAVQQAVQASTVVWNAEKLAGECAVYQDSILAEPAAARECYDFVPAPQTFTMQPLAPTDSGYAQDIGFVSDNFVTFALNDFPGQTVLGTSTDAYYGMDFDPTATTLYALNDDTGELGTIDLTDGTFTALAPCTAPSGNWSGLTIDPVAGTFYASDATNLYTIDPATGASTLVGAFGGGSSLMIDIAMNAAGEMYGHDIGTDSIYQIDPATGAATLVGSTGYDANFAQGMDFDNDDGALYIFLYQGGGANVYGTVDLTTGAVTPLAVSDPQGEFEGAVQTAGFVSIPWLFEDPESGTVPLTVTGGADITFDAGVPEVTQPGDYFGELQINNNDTVWDGFTLPVTMHVTLPATYGQITGTVAGLGPCDDPLTAVPLEGADVLVASATQTWTLTTDADGAYALWLDEAHSPVTITVDALDYVSDTVTGVTVISGTTTAAPDVALRPLAPCATVTPLMIEESLTLGMSTTVPITIGNTGAYTLAWTLSENGGVAWMDQDPAAGETALDGGTSAVTVTLDTADFDQPGTYTATLFVDNDSINDPLTVPVTLTVEPPATWGKLEGLVQGLGYCDAMTMPLEGARVWIQSWMTETVASGGLEEDFEGDDGGFVGALDWEWGTYNWVGGNCGDAYPPPAAHSGADMWGAVLNDCYNNLGDTSILSFSVDLTDPLTATLSWWDWYDVFESFDHGEVYVNGVEVYDRATAYVIPTAWEQHEVDLTPYVGGMATIEFRMYASTVVNRAGWYIDDVRVETDASEMTERPVTWLLTTDVSGTYGIWLDEMYSPLTVTIAYEAGYGEQVFTNVNIISGTVTTLDANLHWLQPCLTPTPDALDLSVPMGTTTTAEINLANMGAFTGSFLLNEWSLGFDMLGIMAAGGPDGFGYRFADSNEAGISPVYDFVDISGIGTPLALGDNDNTEVDIGFDFKFYGADALDPNLYDTVFVGSNGFLSFGAGSDDLSPDPALPDPTLPNNLIAAAWDDLVPGTVYVQSFDQCPYNPDPNTVDACFIVQYDDFSHAGGASAGAWEVILFRSGSILMQYAEVDAPDATTGIENQFGSAGLNYGPTLADDLAICFAYPGEWLDCQTTQVPWLDVDVDEGDIAAYDDLTVTVTLDASVTEIAAPGDYLAELIVSSDDPENPFQIIPVTMTVDMPATMARLSGDIYGWGYCDAVSETLPSADITLQTEHGDHHALTPDADGAYAVWIEAGQITMTVEHEGYFSVTLTDTLDPGFAPQQDMHLHLDAPCASMSYDEAFDIVVVQGERVTRSLMLNNGGAGSLTYDNVLATGLWVQVNPETGAVAPRDAQPVDVRFDSTGLAVGVYQSNMEIVHNDLQASRMFVRPIRMTVVADGTILTPTMDAQEGDPGETVTYVMTVTNFADTAVTFDILASGHVWTTTVPAAVTVAASDTATFTVDVDIPVDAHSGYSDTVTIDVESQGADEQMASALLQTTVAEQPVVLSLTKTADPADYVMPGDTITYTLELVNDGNDPLTIVLTDTIPDGTTYVLGSVTGGAAFDDPPGDHVAWSDILDKGVQHTITFQVTVDTELSGGTLLVEGMRITNTVTATVESAPYTAHAVVEIGSSTKYIYLPLVMRQ